MEKEQRQMTNDQRPRIKSELFFGLWSAVFGLWSCSAFAQNMEDIRDIRGPLGYPQNWILWAIILLASGVIALVIFVWRGVHLSRTVMTPAPAVPAWDKAFERLARLNEHHYPQNGLVKPFYFELSLILRQYVEERFFINAPDMTTEEFLESLRFSAVLNEAQKQVLRNFLVICDMVKFANDTSNADEMNRSFSLVEGFVRQTIPQSEAREGEKGGAGV